MANLGTNGFAGTITTTTSPGASVTLKGPGTWKIKAAAGNTENCTYYVAGIHTLTAANDLPAITPGEEDYFVTRGDEVLTTYSASGLMTLYVKKLRNG